MKVLLPFNKFAYPSGWARPGFDPNHLAAGRSGAMASGIAMPASSVMQQLIFSAAPIFGNNAAIAVNTSIGPAVQCSGAGVTARTGPRMPGTFATPNAFTCGIIYYFLGTGNGGLTPVLAAIGNGGTTQHGIGWTGTSTFTLNFGNSFTPLNSGITQVLTDWVFAAASYDRVSTKYSFLVMGLRTGVIRTASGTSTQTLGSSNDGVLYTGGFSTNNTAGANIAAVMYAENNFLSVSQLVQWAAAPWDFWYQPAITIPQIKTAAPVTSTESGSFVRLPRGNKLAYPGGWARPGFDPSHFAAGNGARMSWVASSGSATGISLLYGTIPVPLNVTAKNTDFGPSANCTANVSFVNITIPHTPINTTPTAVIFAAIIKWQGTFFTDPLIVSAATSSALTQGMGYPIGSPTFLSIEFGASGTNWVQSVINMNNLLNNTTFIAASYHQPSGKYTFIARNLTNNFIQTDSGTNTQTLTASSGTNWYIGGLGAQSNNSNCYMLTAMYSENVFLNVPQLLEWAAAPWDFWYQPIMKPMIVRNPGAISKSRQIQRAAILV